MKKFNKNKTVIALVFSLVFGFTTPVSVLAATTPSLGTAATYSVLGSTYTNTTAGTTISGDVGYTTGPAVTPTISGTTHTADGAYNTAGTDQGSALGALNAQACDFNFGSPTDLSLLSQPLAPGVYCITAATSIGTGGITLSGSGSYIFRINGALTTVANSNVTGASSCNVFWTPAGATTLGANSTFAGTIIDAAGITVGSTVTWTGRALAFGGTVTTDTATINVPSCGAPVVPPPSSTLPTLHVVKFVVNNSGGTANASAFNLHVKLSGTDVAGSPAVGTVAPGTSYSLSAGTYVVSEDANNTSYTQSFSGACDAGGNVTLSAGADVTCTITNDDIEPVVVSPVIIPPVFVPPVVTPPAVIIPTLPKTGYPPQEKNVSWNIIVPAGILGVMFSFFLARKKKLI